MDGGKVRYLSLFSGIECLSVAVEGLGWEPVAFSEIEKAPCRLLAEKYPDVPNLGDIRNIRYDRERDELTNGTTAIPLRGKGIDVVAGGFPCQSVSVAGKRAGMRAGSGTRSSLGHELLRLVGEIRPTLFLVENVPGLLSSARGADFAEFLREMAELGFAAAWRVLDAQYTRTHRFPRAVPQRRRRVWVVGHSGADGRIPAEILFEPAGAVGDRPPRRTQAQASAPAAGRGDSGDDRLVGRPGLLYGGDVSPSIIASDYKGPGNTQDGKVIAAPVAYGCGNGQTGEASIMAPELSQTLNAMHEPQGVLVCTPKAIGIDRAAYNQGANAQYSPSFTPEVSASTVAKGPNAVATFEHHAQDARIRGTEVSPTLGSSGLNQAGSSGNNPLIVSPEVCKTLTAESFDGMPDVQRQSGQQVVAVSTANTHSNGSNINEGGAAYTLDGSASNAVAVQTDCLTPGHPQTHRVFRADGAMPTLNANAGGGQDQRAVLAPVRPGDAPPKACILQMRGGVEVDSNGRKAGKGPLVKSEVAPCIAAAQDTTLFAPSALGFKAGQSSGAGLGAEAEVAPTLSADSSALDPTVAIDGNKLCKNERSGGSGLGVSDKGAMYTLTGSDAHTHAVALPRMVVRRLTPLECERLQGLPDNYTACMGADSPRYRACGNGWAVNCAEWVVRRMDSFLRKGAVQ